MMNQVQVLIAEVNRLKERQVELVKELNEVKKQREENEKELFQKWEDYESISEYCHKLEDRLGQHEDVHAINWKE